MSNTSGPIDPLDFASNVEAEAQTEAQALNYQPIPNDPPPMTEEEMREHRVERRRRLILSIVSSLVTRPLGALLPLITIPLFMKYLGQERFGLFEWVGSVAMYFGITNVGLTLGLINRIQDAHVKGDTLQARRCTSTLTIALGTFAIATTVVLTLLTFKIPWQRVLAFTDPRGLAEIRPAFWVAGFCVVTGLLSGITSAVYIGYQETHKNNIWDAAGKLLSLAMCFAILPTNLGVVGVTLALSGAPSFVRCINLVDMFLREKKHLRPSFKMFDWNLMKSMASDGILLFALQMSAFLLFQSDKLIMGLIVSIKDVAPYAILGRCFLVAYGVYVMLLSPLWPAYGESMRRGDYEWVKKNLRRSTLIGVTLMSACGLVLLLFGQKVIGLIPGGENLYVSKSLILAVTVTFILRAWVDSRSIALNASNVLFPQVWFYGSHAIANIILGIILGRQFGVDGVAWATPITGLLTAAWGYPLLTQKYIFSRKSPPPA